jgi:hypothetical protein
MTRTEGLLARVKVYMAEDKINRMLLFDSMVHTHARRSPTTAYHFAIFWNYVNTLCSYGGDHPLHRKDVDELS